MYKQTETNPACFDAEKLSLDLAALRKTVKRPNQLFDDPVGGAKDLLQHPLLVVQQCRRHHHPPSALPLEKI